MPGLSDKVSTALNETRILILGSQVLLGFQFQAVFQPKFDQLADGIRSLDGIAFGLMLAAVVLLIAPGSFHRLAESGNETVRLHRLTTSLAAIALLPFACCIGIDEYIVAGKILTPSVALTAGCVLTGAAFVAWYSIELFCRHRPPQQERSHEREQEREEIVRASIKEKIKTLGTEIRVVLPGAQALLGFQFSAFLSDGFDKLSDGTKAVHFASVTATAIAVILLMAPAAFHRIAAGGDDTRQVDVFGAYVMLAAMFFLGLSMAGEFNVVLMKATGSPMLALIGPLGAVIATFAIWFAVPLRARRRPLSVR